MTHDTLRQALLHGIAMARDPRNAMACNPTDLRVTTLYSPWLLKTCRQCGHTFREDDLVLPHPNAQLVATMLHEDPTQRLCCWSKAQQARPALPPAPLCSPPVREAFLHGLHTTWKPAGGLVAELVVPGSDLLRRRCPICRHTVRLGDHVVRCPCGHACGGVFHQDITRHLTCWDTWSIGMRRSHCAFTGMPYASGRAEDER